MQIKFWENWSKGTVEVFDNDRLVYSNREYRGSAEWAQRTYGLTDAQLMSIYYDYKADFDGDYDED